MNLRHSIILLVSALFLLSCSPRIIETVRTEKEYIDRWHEKTDSVYVKDSIFIKEKGDTVYIEKWRERWRYKTDIQIDTFMHEVHDTTTVEVLVEKKLTPMQEVKQKSFWWLVLCVVALLVWTFRKQIKKLIP